MSNREAQIYKKALNALNGLIMSWKDDKSVRFAYKTSIFVSLSMFIFQPNIVTKILSLLIYLLWILTETINTSIEATVNNTSMAYMNINNTINIDNQFDVKGCNIDSDKPHINCQAKLAKDTGATLSAIVVLFMIIATGLFIYNIILKYNEWKKNNKNKNIIEYIKWTFSN